MKKIIDFLNPDKMGPRWCAPGLGSGFIHTRDKVRFFIFTFVVSSIAAGVAVALTKLMRGLC